jgi:hypothetical protein
MIKTNVEVITPAVAAEYLRLYNQGNRKPNKAQVAYYAKMMSEGEWELNGESIKFSGSGETLRLLDGQHRLMACVEANVPFETLVVRDIDEKTFDTLDQGWLRKKGQIFSIANIPNSTNVSSAINKYLNMGRHKTTSMHAAGAGGSAVIYGETKVSPREALDEYNRDSDFWQELHKMTDAMYRRCRLMNQTDVAAIIAHLTLRCNYELSFVVNFFEQLFYEERTELDIIRKLRQRLINDSMSTIRMTPQMKTQIIRKTWDFYKDGKSPNLIKWVKGVEEELPFS